MWWRNFYNDGRNRQDQRHFKEGKIQFSITPHKITEVANLEGYDLIVVTGKTNATNKAGAPVMLGLPLFTGVGAEEFTEELLKEIRRIMEE